MTNTPAVSVIIPTFNRRALLREALESVRRQTFADWEAIVADDGSTDDTAADVEQLGDGRIRVLRLAHSGNVARVRNAALGVARGEWIAFLDSDDIWLPHKLERQLVEIRAQSPPRRWSSTAVGFIDERGQPAARRSGKATTGAPGWILERLLVHDVEATMSTLLVHRSLIEQVGVFDEDFQTASREDYDFALRLAERAEAQPCSEALSLIRQHAGRSTDAQRVADLFGYNALAFHKAAARASTVRIRTMCKRQAARNLVERARVLSHARNHAGALSAATRALSDAPLAFSVWKALAGCSLRVVGLRHRASATDS